MSTSAPFIYQGALSEQASHQPGLDRTLPWRPEAEVDLESKARVDGIDRGLWRPPRTRKAGRFGTLRIRE